MELQRGKSEMTTTTGNNPFVDRAGEMEVPLQAMLGALLRYEPVAAIPQYRPSIELLVEEIVEWPASLAYWETLIVLYSEVMYRSPNYALYYDFEFRMADKSYVQLKFTWHKPEFRGWVFSPVTFNYNLETREAKVRWRGLRCDEKQAQFITGYATAEKWAEACNSPA
jgi:hypothetical protein